MMNLKPTRRQKILFLAFGICGILAAVAVNLP
jgi:hypothetical protein